MKHTLLLILFFVFASTINAQTHAICGTANPTTAEYNFTKNTVANIIFAKNAGTTCIPIRPHIVTKTDGTGGISMLDINLGISHLNEYYFDAGIEFYICGTSPDYINSDLHYDFSTANEAAMASAGNEVTNAINMYFVNGIDYTGGASYIAGYAYLPANSIHSTRVVMRNGSTADGLTLIHELGHHFNLLHTFNGTINGNNDPNAENVPRPPSGQANCTTDGDLLCDTDADPGYTPGTFNSGTCTYTGGASDINGIAYVPPISNVMSYFPSSCQNPSVLTPEQYVRIQQGKVVRDGHNAYTMDCPATLVLDPSGLNASFNGLSVNLTWTDNSNNELGFFIERSTVSATTGFRAFGGFATDENVTSFSDNSLSSNTTYYYRIKAVNDACNEYSNVATITTSNILCGATGTNSTDEYISSVSLNTIANVTAGNNYTNYSNTISTDLTIGVSYPYTILSAGNGGNGYPQDTCAIWIDWNQDGDFNDIGENITNTGGIAPYTGNITPPATATIGNTIMRVRIHYNEEPSSPCGPSVWGEVEDYGINVISNSTCAIASLTAGTQTACVSATNTYTQELTVTYSTPPASGTLDV
ncbi:MAG: GEVED domain-containing protein, partial [Chitinophagales bacterium]